MNRPKASPAPHKEIIDGPTSHGGSYSVTYYFDEKYKPIAKNSASRSITHEYDDKNRSVYRDYNILSKGQPIFRKKKAKNPADDTVTELCPVFPENLSEFLDEKVEHDV